MKREMTEDRKSKALKGHKLEQLRWLREEVAEFEESFNRVNTKIRVFNLIPGDPIALDVETIMEGFDSLVCAYRFKLNASTLLLAPVVLSPGRKERFDLLTKFGTIIELINHGIQKDPEMIQAVWDYWNYKQERRGRNSYNWDDVASYIESGFWNKGYTRNLPEHETLN